MYFNYAVNEETNSLICISGICHSTAVHTVRTTNEYSLRCLQKLKKLPFIFSHSFPVAFTPQMHTMEERKPGNKIFSLLNAADRCIMC